MDISTLFSYVPLIGAHNLLTVADADSGQSVPFLASLAADDAVWVPKNATGDYGNNPAPGSVASFTDTDPVGRAGNMITHLEIIGEGESEIDEVGTFLALVAIPAGENHLLGNGYTLSKQPPADFDMSSFLPRVDAKGKPSMYGTADSFDFFAGLPTGRFPSGPRTRAYLTASAYTVMYIPQSFFGNLNTILNDFIDVPNVFNVSVKPNTALYGAILIAAQFAGDEEDYPLLGAGDLTVDFSHSGTN